MMSGLQPPHVLPGSLPHRNLGARARGHWGQPVLRQC